MRYAIKTLIISFLLFSGSIGYSCSLKSSHPYFYSGDKLVRYTSNIYLVEVVSIHEIVRPNVDHLSGLDRFKKLNEFTNKGTHLLKLKIIETLKGVAKDTISIDANIKEIDKYHIHSNDFAMSNSGRSSLTPSCGVIPVGAVSGHFIWFENSYASKGFERIFIKSDPWYEFVKVNAKQYLCNGPEFFCRY